MQFVRVFTLTTPHACLRLHVKTSSSTTTPSTEHAWLKRTSCRTLTAMKWLQTAHTNALACSWTAENGHCTIGMDLLDGKGSNSSRTHLGFVLDATTSNIEPRSLVLVFGVPRQTPYSKSASASLICLGLRLSDVSLQSGSADV